MVVNMRKFTLLELLVIVALIGILLSILLPSLQKARFSAKNAVCMSNLKQIGAGIMLHVNSNSGNMSPRARGEVIWGGIGTWSGLSWDEYIYDYMQDTVSWTSKPPEEIRFEILACPLDEFKAAEQRQRRSYKWNNGRFRDHANNLKENKFHQQPFQFTGIKAAYGEGEDSNMIIMADYFYRNEAYDATFGYNGGSIGTWGMLRNNEGKHHSDLSRNGLTTSGSVIHFKQSSLSNDYMVRSNGDYQLPVTD